MAGSGKLRCGVGTILEWPLWVAPALQEFFGDFCGHFVSTVVCPACLCGGVPLALMNSASEVPIGLSASKGRCHSRRVSDLLCMTDPVHASPKGSMNDHL
ncbi:hypothetical protein ACEWPL_019470, partial [Roseovarius sp. S1116L3]|uniref:hypothetical protein n=1 Tax=Roseovarius roseus TaxID=3342636 RepID=UPI003B671583